MKKYQPYIDWDRFQFEEHFSKQIARFKYIDAKRVYTAVHDRNWEPSRDYDGCTLIQDEIHPYIPCFLHDHAWITGDDASVADKMFLQDLQVFGTPKWKAVLMYIAVRVAWVCYYKWKKRKCVKLGIKFRKGRR